MGGCRHSLSNDAHDICGDEHAGSASASVKERIRLDIGAISGVLAVRVFLYGLSGPFAAVLMQRFGVRRVVPIALGMIVVGLVAAMRMTALWQLWICWGIMLGIATGVTVNVLGATIATRWFTKRRGLVVGTLSASNATGQLLFLPVAAWLSEHVGWRTAMLPATALCALCFVPVQLILRDYPADVGLPPYGEDTVLPSSSLRDGNSVLEASFGALRAASANPTLWVLAGSFFLCGLSTSGLVQNHFIPLCHDFGVDTVAAAGILAMMGAFDFVGTIGSGWLSDRLDNRWLLFWYYGLRGVSLLILPLTNFSLYGLSIFAVFYGLDWVATVPPTVKFTAHKFGRERAPLVFSWIFLAHQLALVEWLCRTADRIDPARGRRSYNRLGRGASESDSEVTRKLL